MGEKIGIYICECGPNIANKVYIDKIIEKISSIEAYKNKELVIKNHKLLCSIDGKKFLEEEIKQNEFTHLVIAACSPKDHESTFINICKKTHLNPYLFRIVNIREQCAWIISDRDEATEKAIQYIRGSINRVLYQSPLEEKKLDSNPDVLVIGGGIAGIETALSLASKKRKVYLIEKTSKLGGKSAKFRKLLPRQNCNTDVIQKKLLDVEENNHIQIFKETELEKAIGFFGNFEVILKNVKDNNLKTELRVGAIIVASGFKQLNTSELPKYEYTQDDDVYTSLEIEEMCSQNGKVLLKSGEEPRSIALIHCVGREEKGYCSQICCNYMLKIAQYLEQQSSDIKIKEFYRDLCLPNKDDQFFLENLQNSAIDFIRIKDIEIKGNKIKYIGTDDIEKEIEVDMLILAPAMEAEDGATELAELLNIQLDETGFFQEAHQKLNPIATSTDGIFIVGAARGPSGISESILQAQAVGGEILTQLIPGEKIIPEVKVSEVLEALCKGCQTCLNVCTYGAIYFDEDRGISVVNEAICRGCGNCMGSCPSGAIRSKHFTNPQLYQEMVEALR